jgi:hypothetical protein
MTEQLDPQGTPKVTESAAGERPVTPPKFNRPNWQFSGRRGTPVNANDEPATNLPPEVRTSLDRLAAERRANTPGSPPVSAAPQPVERRSGDAEPGAAPPISPNTVPGTPSVTPGVAANEVTGSAEVSGLSTSPIEAVPLDGMPAPVVSETGVSTPASASADTPGQAQPDSADQARTETFAEPVTGEPNKRPPARKLTAAERKKRAKAKAKAQKKRKSGKPAKSGSTEQGGLKRLFNKKGEEEFVIDEVVEEVSVPDAPPPATAPVATVPPPEEENVAYLDPSDLPPARLGAEDAELGVASFGISPTLRALMNAEPAERGPLPVPMPVRRERASRSAEIRGDAPTNDQNLRERPRLTPPPPPMRRTYQRRIERAESPSGDRIEEKEIRSRLDEKFRQLHDLFDHNQPRR